MFRMEERADFMIKSNQRPKDGKETLTCATGRVKVERIILEHHITHKKCPRPPNDKKYSTTNPLETKSETIYFSFISVSYT